MAHRCELHSLQYTLKRKVKVLSRQSYQPMLHDRRTPYHPQCPPVCALAFLPCSLQIPPVNIDHTVNNLIILLIVGRQYNSSGSIFEARQRLNRLNN